MGAQTPPAHDAAGMGPWPAFAASRPAAAALSAAIRESTHFGRSPALNQRAAAHPRRHRRWWWQRVARRGVDAPAPSVAEAARPPCEPTSA
jgi:hypothetical protein